jgi:hypothetical protein
MTIKPAKKHEYSMSELNRLSGLREIGCIACCEPGYMRWPVEVHHLTNAGRRLGHQHTIPLCEWHHRGVLDFGFTRTSMRETFGPSLADGSKPFHKKYGSDRKLLRMTNRLLRQFMEG